MYGKGRDTKKFENPWVTSSTFKFKRVRIMLSLGYCNQSRLCPKQSQFSVSVIVNGIKVLKEFHYTYSGYYNFFFLVSPFGCLRYFCV